MAPRDTLKIEPSSASNQSAAGSMALAASTGNAFALTNEFMSTGRYLRLLRGTCHHEINGKTCHQPALCTTLTKYFICPKFRDGRCNNPDFTHAGFKEVKDGKIDVMMAHVKASCKFVVKYGCDRGSCPERFGHDNVLIRRELFAQKKAGADEQRRLEVNRMDDGTVRQLEKLQNPFTNASKSSKRKALDRIMAKVEQDKIGDEFSEEYVDSVLAKHGHQAKRFKKG